MNKSCFANIKPGDLLKNQSNWRWAKEMDCPPPGTYFLVIKIIHMGAVYCTGEFLALGNCSKYHLF